MGLGDLLHDWLVGVWNAIQEGFENAIVKPFQSLAESIYSWFLSPGLDALKTEIAVSSLDENLFMTEEIRNWVKWFKQQLLSSPESGCDFAQTLFNVVAGRVAELQIEQIVGKDITSNQKYASNMFSAMALITDITLLSTILGVIGEFIPFLHLDRIGSELRAFLNYSGLAQITGYGYGMILANLLTDPVKYELNQLMLETRMPLSTAFDAFGRFKIGYTELYKHMRYAGLDPDRPLELTDEEKDLGYGMWYTTESIVSNPLDPSKWVPDVIDTYGKLYQRLAESPATYFILNEVARSGFYKRDLFQQALLDSSYGPLPMALILQGCETAFIRRHITKYEDEYIDMFLSGELTDDEFKDALKDLYPSDDMVNIIYQFFKNKHIRTRRIGVRTLVEQGMKAGKLTETEATQMLISAGYKPAYVSLIIDLIKQEMQAEKQLTSSQICRMYARDVMDIDTAFSRLTNSGYDADDARDLLKLYAKKEKWSEIDNYYNTHYGGAS